MTADVLEDWSRPSQISQNLIASHTIVVRYCAYHFPKNSQALANLKTAIAAYNAIPGLTIEITDIAEEPDTQHHPDMATFAPPDNAIYFDYDNIKKGAYAATSKRNCNHASPQQCTKAHIYVTDTSPAFTNPRNIDEAPSVGVFMHELGHVFGLAHIDDVRDDGTPLAKPIYRGIDRTTIHGWKTQEQDYRSDLIQAGTLAFLRSYYADDTVLGLDTDELVADRNMSTVVDDASHVEWNPAKTYTRGDTTPIDDLNETKLRWNSADNTFEPCNYYGTLPRWFAKMSETSTNATNKQFDAAFEVTNNDAGSSWTAVGTETFDSTGTHDFRQLDWERTFKISLADIGVTKISDVVDRKMRFRADSGNDLTERDEGNNEWWVNVCFYPESSTSCSRTCLQPSSPGVDGGHDDDWDDDSDGD
jgi:hypothetical protein